VSAPVPSWAREPTTPPRWPERWRTRWEIAGERPAGWAEAKRHWLRRQCGNDNLQKAWITCDYCGRDALCELGYACPPWCGCGYDTGGCEPVIALCGICGGNPWRWAESSAP
jgi:hypothetical protein